MNRKVRFSNSRVLVGHLGSIYSLSTLGDQLLSTGGDGNLVRWDTKAENPGYVFANVETQLYTLCVCKALIVAGSMNGAIFFIDHQTRALRSKILHHEKGVFAILSMDDRMLTGGGDGILTLWDLQNLLPIYSIRISTASIRCLTHLEGNVFCVGCSEGNLYLCEVRGETIRILQTMVKAHSSSVFCVSYDAERQLLISGGRDAQLRIWNRSLEQIHTIAAHLFTINAIAIQPTLGLFATASRDKTIKLWDLEQLTLLQVLEPLRDFGHFNSVNALQWIGESLFSGSDDKRIISWQWNETNE